MMMLMMMQLQQRLHASSCPGPSNTVWLATTAIVRPGKTANLPGPLSPSAAL